MGVRILVGHEQGTEIESAVLFCSTSGWAFGPVMDGREVAEAFLTWLRADPRDYKDHELESKWTEFYAVTHDRRGEVIRERIDTLLEERERAAYAVAYRISRDHRYV